MFGRTTDLPSRIDTLIGKSARIEGDITFEGGLHLDGQVTGNVRAEGAKASLSVSESGRVDGSVDAAVVVVHGTVCGDIRAGERLVLGARAKVQGSVYYGLIESASGAEIKGKLVPLGASAAPAAPAEESSAAAAFDPAAGAS